MSAGRPAQTPVELEPDLARCDAEPIHAPGAIQPHGVLLAVDADARVVMASANLDAMCGRAPTDLLGRPLSALVGDEVAAQVARAASSGEPAEPCSMRLALDGRRLEGTAHRRGDLILLELEPELEAPGELDALLGGALARLQTASGLAELHAITAAQIHALAGFERVMVYRFDEDEHGEVVAEVRPPDLDPYLGLHYPASDIPAPARALYLRSWLRLIPDAREAAVPLVSAGAALPSQPPASIDLGGAALRAVPAVHLEYLGNMGVRASMSVSIVVRGRLWGLIACHHREVRRVPYRVRSACELVGRLVSLQIAALEELEERRVWSERQVHIEEAVRAVRQEEDVFAGLLRAPGALLAVASAGGAALVLGGEHIGSAGAAPPAGDVERLAAWLEQGFPDGHRSHALGRDFEPARRYRDRASGVLAVPIPRPGPSFLLLFRPELVETVSWGGDPRRPIDNVDEAGRIHPRRSFATWRERVEGQSRRFSAVEAQLAAELRRRLIELDLERQVERARVAVQARDDLVAVVSHDLRGPLGIIQLQLGLADDMLAEQPEDPARRLRTALERIQRSADRMSALVTDLLDLSRIDAGRFSIEPRREDAGELVDEALAALRDVAERKSIDVRVTPAPPLKVLADAERVFQVMSNVIGNAIKFTPSGGAICIQVEQLGAEVRFQVADTGPGVAREDLPRLFDRYWRSRRASASGTGLGLFIARGIVEAHGGRIWAESEPGRGTVISFTLPAA